jgi:hypothetical protein
MLDAIFEKAIARELAAGGPLRLKNKTRTKGCEVFGIAGSFAHGGGLKGRAVGF